MTDTAPDTRPVEHDDPETPLLGAATTEELLDELIARLDVSASAGNDTARETATDLARVRRDLRDSLAGPALLRYRTVDS